MTEKVTPIREIASVRREDVAKMLRELADEWADKPLGKGVICVVVQEENLPVIYAYGDVGVAVVELELARMKLFDLLMSRSS